MYLVVAAGVVKADDGYQLIAEYKEVIDKQERQLTKKPNFYSNSINQIVDVKATHNRSFILTNKGEIWAWG